MTHHARRDVPEIRPTIDARDVRAWIRRDPVGFWQFVDELGRPLAPDMLARILADKRELAAFVLELAPRVASADPVTFRDRR